MFLLIILLICILFIVSLKVSTFCISRTISLVLLQISWGHVHELAPMLGCLALIDLPWPTQHVNSKDLFASQSKHKGGCFCPGSAHGSAFNMFGEQPALNTCGRAESTESSASRCSMLVARSARIAKSWIGNKNALQKGRLQVQKWPSPPTPLGTHSCKPVDSMMSGFDDVWWSADWEQGGAVVHDDY